MYENQRKKSVRSLVSGALGLMVLTLTSPVWAVQFSYLDPAYTQEIFTGPASGLGLTFTQDGHLVVQNDWFGPSGTVTVYSLTADTTYQGTTVHSGTVQSVSGLGFGRGITTGTDGLLYSNTSSGIQAIDATTWTATTIPGSAGGSYGIGTLSDGRIVHSDSSNIYILNPTTGTDTFIYAAGTFIDGLTVSPTDEIFLAGLSEGHVIVISTTGALINDVAVTHSPDGMAFGAGSAFANNTDGTITRLTFAGAGYTGAVTETLFASGGAYGDLATVGPDGAFYVTQWGPGGGLHWDNGTTTSDLAVVRISLPGGGGFEPPAGTPGEPPTGGVPEPSTLLLLGAGLVGLFARKGGLVY